jgi:hypothetical protein
MRGPSLIGIAVLALTTGCASGGRPLKAALTREPSRHVEVWSAHAEDDGDVVVVRGLVRRPALDRHPLWGHVHIEARFRDGRAPFVAEALWNKPSTKGSRTAPYWARLPIPDEAAVTDIIISYAPGRHADEANAGPSA